MPPTFPARIANFVADRLGAAARTAARVEQIARSVAGSEQTRVVTVPGGNPGQSYPPNERTARQIRDWEIYAGRVAATAGPMRDRHALWNATDLTPQTIGNAQRSAVASGMPLEWVELIDHIYSRDIDYASVTDQRVADVVRGRWTFRRAGNDAASDIALAFATEAKDGCERWRDGLEWLLYSNLYSFNNAEVEWETRLVSIQGPPQVRGGTGKTIGPFWAAMPRRLHNAHPKHFRFDPYTDDPLLWIVDGHQPLPIGKFIFMEGLGGHPIKVRHGHAWQCLWMSMFTSMAIAGWSSRVGRFDMPIPIVEADFDVAQYPEMQAAWQDILNALGSGNGAVIPTNHGRLRIEQPPSGGKANDPQSALWDACRTAKTVRVLGAELANSTGNVGSYSAKTQDIATKYNLEERDAARLAERIDEQLTKPLLLFNAESLAAAANAAGYNVTPDQLYRRAPLGKQSVPRDMTPQVRAEVGAILINKWGMPLSAEAEFEQFDFQRSRDDLDQLRGEAQQVAKGGALKTPADASAGNAGVPDPEAQAKADAITEGKPTTATGGNEGN